MRSGNPIVPGTFKERSYEPLVGRGLVSRRFDSMKSVCNGGTKAPPYNAPLTQRGAFRKKIAPKGKCNHT